LLAIAAEGPPATGAAPASNAEAISATTNRRRALKAFAYMGSPPSAVAFRAPAGLAALSAEGLDRGEVAADLADQRIA
jgi:hypothetical protein